MEQIELRIPSVAPGAGGRLADLLRDWVAGTPDADALRDIRVRPDGEEAVATLDRDGRRIDVVLHHATDDRWVLDASTVARPHEEPTRGWSVLAGLLMFLLGFVLSLRWLSYGVGPFLLGVAVAVALGLIVGLMTHRRRSDRLQAATTREQGGQGPAHDIVDAIAAVLRADDRVQVLGAT